MLIKGEIPPLNYVIKGEIPPLNYVIKGETHRFIRSCDI